METLTSAQKAVQAVKNENSNNVATVEINDTYYDVVYKDDKGEFCDLTGLDKQVNALSLAVLSAHENTSKSLDPNEISHIDSVGVHYTDKTSEAHESVNLDDKGFESLDEHLGLTSTIESISGIYENVENLKESDIKYDAVLNSLPSDLKPKVEAAIESNKTKANLLEQLDLCANEYLSEKLDPSQGLSATKTPIVHENGNAKKIDKNASIQAFKDAATARHAWDAMNVTIGKTHHTASKAPIPSSLSLNSGVTFVPNTSTRLDNQKKPEPLKDFSNLQTTPTSTPSDSPSKDGSAPSGTFSPSKPKSSKQKGLANQAGLKPNNHQKDDAPPQLAPVSEATSSPSSSSSTSSRVGGDEQSAPTNSSFNKETCYKEKSVPKDTQVAKKNILKHLSKNDSKITNEEKNYLFNLVEQVEKEDIKTKQIKMKRLEQLLRDNSNPS